VGLIGAAVAVAAVIALPSSALAKRNAYVSNSGSSNVAAFDIGPEGSLSQLSGSPFGGAEGAEGVTMTPDGRHLYTPSFIENTVAAYSVAPNGSLSLVTGSPFPAAGLHFTVAITPDGNHLYVPEFGGHVYAFNVAADGSLSPVTGSPFTAPGDAFGVAVTPDGNRLYVSSTGNERIYAFNIAADGSLNAIAGSPFIFSGTGPRGLAVTPDGAHLYAGDIANNKVQIFNIATDGSLAIQPSPPSTGEGPVNLAVTPDGAHLYSSDLSGNDVSGFDIAANGSLTATPGSPYPAGELSEGVAPSPDGRRLYVASFTDSQVRAFDIAADGSLSPVAGSPFSSGGENPAVESIALTPNQAPIAALSAATSRRMATFDAAASSDADGSVVRYDWNFGDGTTLANGGPTPSHTYGADGTYAATVTVTDNEGCSTKLLFTGQIASCNGGAGASVSRQVVIDTVVANPRLIAHRTQRQKGRKVKVKVKAGAAEAVKIALGGTVTVSGGGEPRKSYKLRGVTKHSAAGALSSAILAPKGKKATTAILAAIAGKRKVRAKISAKFTDPVGNKATKSASVKLR
jgi:6-phosphogluconolactonase (cycloisomerase 2 family)